MYMYVWHACTWHTHAQACIYLAGFIAHSLAVALVRQVAGRPPDLYGFGRCEAWWEGELHLNPFSLHASI